MSKTQARLDADARYEAAREQVLIRLTRDEAATVDKARGELSRPEYMKRKALTAAKRTKERTHG